MLHIGTLSSGKMSAYTCKLMIDEVGPENSTLIFTDTNWEHPDNYRFLKELVDYFGVHFLHLKEYENENPLTLAWKKKALPSNRMPFCSELLKFRPLKKYVQSLGEPVTVWWGIDATEAHRTERIISNWDKNVKAETYHRFPLIEKATPTEKVVAWLEDIGIEPPIMYKMGFTHANCFGGCVRAGHYQWKHLYKVWPERFEYVAALEEKWRQDFGKDYAILKTSVKGVRQPLTLYALKERILKEEEIDEEDKDDGACACFLSFEEAPVGDDE